MKEKPILFSTSMVQAILEGRKTQTRRIVKDIALEWLKAGFTLEFVSNSYNDLCPYGQIGDVLWVREKWRKNEWPIGFKYDFYADDTVYMDKDSERWKPSIHMPREACRLFLEITDIRVERLQDISAKDAISEGIIHKSMNCPKVEFQHLWQSINGAESWQSNPFVWVIEFKRIER